MNIRVHWLTTIYLLVQLLVSSNAAYADELQQLLTSVQQRSQIDLERWQAKQPKAQKNGDAFAPVVAQRQLFFEALLKTEKGHSVWLNGRMLEAKETIQGIVIDPNQIRASQLLLQTPKGLRRLSLGQVYWIEQDKVLEPYEKP